jgi:hypothetical protein
MSTSEVEEIISKTIIQLQKQEGAVQFKKPKTMQGWVYICLGLGSVVAFLWTSIVFLNDIAKHQEEAHHHGTVELFEKIEASQLAHNTSEDLHRREEQLELQIMKEVSPIKRDLSNIQQNQIHFRQDIGDIRQDLKDVQRSINQIADKLN